MLGLRATRVQLGLPRGLRDRRVPADNPRQLGWNGRARGGARSVCLFTAAVGVLTFGLHQGCPTTAADHHRRDARCGPVRDGRRGGQRDAAGRLDRHHADRRPRPGLAGPVALDVPERPERSSPNSVPCCSLAALTHWPSMCVCAARAAPGSRRPAVRRAARAARLSGRPHRRADRFAGAGPCRPCTSSARSGPWSAGTGIARSGSTHSHRLLGASRPISLWTTAGRSRLALVG